MAVAESQVLDALRSVMDPDLHRDIVSLGFVQGVEIEGGAVRFRIELTTPACPVKDQLEAEARANVLAIPGVESCEIEMTSAVRSRPTEPQDLIPSVRQCVAIASGKGGVGKSTVTANLAVALAQAGGRVGLLDADVYGPSIPAMLGLDGERPLTRDGKLVPLERYGVKTMSLGFLLEEGQAVLWRGPMVAGTVKQLLADVAWGELDYLLVDLPPGTGDAPMSLAQLVPLSGVVVVTTPHALAASIARKATELFRRLDSPILGVIENMGEAVCGNCGTTIRLFGGAPGDELAASLGVPLLGTIPFDAQTGSGESVGLPSVVGSPGSPAALAFLKAASRMAAELSVRAVGSPQAAATS
jgi:ATP-binding protein involved in chromosome partitioning